MIIILALTGCTGFPENVPSAFEPAAPELTEEQKAALRREEQLLPLLAEADRLAQGYYYEEALQRLANVPEEFLADEALTDA